METTFIPATKRQLWALFCITKNDYRNKNLSKDEASKLIAELSEKNPRSNKTTKMTLTDELLNYIKDNFDRIFNNSVQSLKHRSVVVNGLNPTERYAFVGVGCGITYLTFRKNNSKAIEINKAANNFHNNEIMKLFISKFSKKEYDYYMKIGNPLEALWSQYQGMQQAYYSIVVEFAKSKGVKMQMKSFLD